MPIPIFKIFMVFGIVSAWAAKALEDGKITLDEAADLAVQLGGALGIPTSVDIPEPALEAEERKTGAQDDVTVDAASTETVESILPSQK